MQLAGKVNSQADWRRFSLLNLSREYFQSHSEDSLINLSSFFCDSTQSFFNDDYKTSLLINQMECDKCKNLILRQENRRCSMCCECVEKLYSPKTCMACNGRISFQELNDSTIQDHSKKRYFSELSDPSSLRLCNCFPKYPSQNLSSFQATKQSEIQTLPSIVGKSSSCNELVLTQQKKSSGPSFYSQSCLRVTTSFSEESSSGED